MNDILRGVIDMLKKLLSFMARLYPPPVWRPVVIFLLGIFCGLGLVVLHISNAFSYLSDDPATCMNCHVMTPQYATWQRSSHRERATCNDCHVPQDNVSRKFAFKAQDGMRHASMFTLRLEPQVIRIENDGRNVVQENCLRCHTGLIETLVAGGINEKSHIARMEKRCVDCHQEVPHGTVNSLASTPYARVPRLSPVVPDWISKIAKKKKTDDIYRQDRLKTQRKTLIRQ